MTDKELSERLDRIEGRAGGDGCGFIIFVIVALIWLRGC
jgi:hypothetical protein